ncbi:hypothetical protein QVD17_14606 [Tagetes erecta]|uniref:Uncharacterized protein n=1 Tax=Tagetes erecta TaxID=13708 RepID=A0AAD8NWW6_TARER|nr:hypothetical protein QVD17_14606 [Tagetes erecta]
MYPPTKTLIIATSESVRFRDKAINQAAIDANLQKDRYGAYPTSKLTQALGGLINPTKNMIHNWESTESDFPIVLLVEGIEAYDAYTQEQLTLRVNVQWMINDYHALGTLCGCPYIGFNGCVELGIAANPMTVEEIYNAVQYVKNPSASSSNRWILQLIVAGFVHLRLHHIATLQDSQATSSPPVIVHRHITGSVAISFPMATSVPSTLSLSSSAGSLATSSSPPSHAPPPVYLAVVLEYLAAEVEGEVKVLENDNKVNQWWCVRWRRRRSGQRAGGSDDGNSVEGKEVAIGEEMAKEPVM